MSYISRVKNTLNQHFEIHDPRLGEGVEINVSKDWAVNDTQSSKYIKNRTHYTDNRFEVIDLEWTGFFPDITHGPAKRDLTNGILYLVSKIPLTNEELTATFFGDIHLYYKVSGAAAQTGTLADIFPSDATNFVLTTTVTQDVTEAVYGSATNNFVVYSVAAEQEIEINGITLTLTPGIYGYAESDKPNIVRYENEVHRLNEKYIPLSILTRISDLEVGQQGTSGQIANLTTKTYVDNLVSTTAAGKMDKQNPIGIGDFYLKKTAQNLGGRAFYASDIYVNYTTQYWILDNGAMVSKTESEAEALVGYTTVEVNSVPEVADAEANKIYKITTSKLVATKEYVDNGLATKMDAATRIFNELYIGDALSNSRVLTTDDISSIKGNEFIGIFASDVYLPSSVNEGDYAYVLATYTTGSNAQATKYIYENGDWTPAIVNSSQYVLSNTFTPQQWKNINTDVESLLNSLGISYLNERVAELEAKVNVMFEFAEGQEF